MFARLVYIRSHLGWNYQALSLSSYFYSDSKAPVTHSRFWLRLITIHPDETYIVKSGCIGMIKTENSEIPSMSHDVPTVSLRLIMVLLR